MAARSRDGVSPLRTAAVTPHRRITELPGDAAYLAARLREVLVDVGRERLQRRDVNHAHFVGKAAGGNAFPDQRVYRGKEGSERFARSGRCSDERIFAPTYRGPSLPLCVGRREHAACAFLPFGEAGVPPAANGGMKVGGEHEAVRWARREKRVFDCEGQGKFGRHGLAIAIEIQVTYYCYRNWSSE
jgi:hypothetical protein